MLPPEQAARAFVARLDAGLGLSVTTLYASDSLLRDAVAGLIAAERKAVREACLQAVAAERRRCMATVLCTPESADLIDSAIRALPLE